MEALFTSLVGGNAVRRRIAELIDEASSLAAAERVDLHLMTFAFTDMELAQALADAATRRPSLRIRVLADWSQRIRARGQQVSPLASLNLPNLQVRYSHDQPYVWDPAAEHMRWSYHTSRGLLHHKTIGVLVDGRPWKLICGSFNWTAAAAASYENLLILTCEKPASVRLMARIELEFEALWSDGRASLSPEEAHLHYRAILDEYHRNPAISPEAIGGLVQGAGQHLHVLDLEHYPPEHEDQGALTNDATRSTEPSAAIAFCCRGLTKRRGCGGHAGHNRQQRLLLRTPAGTTRCVPLTITAIALETIFRAAPGDTLKIAMYGMSSRVAEYGALLEAARRDVHVCLLLDRLVGSDLASRLNVARQQENLPIEVRTVGKMMHEKYIIHPETGTVVTGTANMSTDASTRHSEHRIRIGGCEKLAAQFIADFDQIWTRLSAHAVPKIADEKVDS